MSLTDGNVRLKFRMTLFGVFRAQETCLVAENVFLLYFFSVKRNLNIEANVIVPECTVLWDLVVSDQRRAHSCVMRGNGKTLRLMLTVLIL